MSKLFIDSNILVYAMDKHDLKKGKHCRKILRDLNTGETSGVLSTQVLQEFYVVSTKKLSIEPLLVKNILHTFENFEVVVVTVALIKEAIDTSILYKITFWDALIIVSAESAKCEKVLTEDLNHGQIIRGVRVENPFEILKKP